MRLHPKLGIGQRILRLLPWLVGVLLTVVLISTFAQRNYGCDWTGFGECFRDKGANQEFRPEKTLWDWLALLGVPAVLAGVGLAFNYGQTQAEHRRAAADQQRAEQRAAADQQRDADRAEDALLREYFDRLSDLLLRADGLRNSQPGAEVRSVARSRTLVTLARLNGERKASLLRFLYESNVITKDRVVIDLHRADLTGANLKDVNLKAADLHRTELQRAVLTGANLYQADLKEANLQAADLRRTHLQAADLKGANLREAKLHGTKLQGAVLTGAYLQGAVYTSKTQWPDNFDPQAAGAELQDTL